MRERSLAGPLAELCFADHRMALVSGPRRCGKTVLGRMLLRERGCGRYANWDDPAFRRLWAKDPGAVVPPAKGGRTPLVVLDEIHKAPLWKRTLKGLYDTRESPADILVTGSARLAVYRKGGDSLLGRYFPFRLHPFSLREMETAEVFPPDQAREALFERSPSFLPARQERLEALLEFGPFPEPLFRRDRRQARLWRQNRLEAVIREDLRDLTRIPELGRLETLAALLPERVGSPFSMSALREILEVSLDTVRRWLAALQELYYLYEVRPYHRRLARSLRREGKIYLWDYSEVPGRAARFENLVAGHLLKACHFWTDTGEGKFELFCLRDKEGREIDFLIVRDGAPWLAVEAKIAETAPSPHWRRFLGALGCRRALQAVLRPGVWRREEEGETRLLVASAAEALARLV